MTKKIVLVTSGQPSANPRLVKEVTALIEAGCQLTVIYCPLSPWADGYDQELFRKYPQIKWVAVGVHPLRSKFLYLLVRLRKKIYTYLFSCMKGNTKIALRAFVFYGTELMSAACREKAALYIGHNLGALPAVVMAAKKHNAKAGFDFEDYHRGEDQPGSLHQRLVSLLENKYVPDLNYATAASPLIAKAYQEHFEKPRIQTLLNVFPNSYAVPGLTSLTPKPLKLFWFSQYIGKGRGLEQVLAAMGKLGADDIQLSLLGNCTDEMRQYFQDKARLVGLSEEQLQFLPPVPEKEIVTLAAQHHIGLAVEIPHNRNRDLCLTNKIFMYLLAGNAIIFTNTVAQEAFFARHPHIGSVFSEGNIDALAGVLQNYLYHPDILHQQRAASLALGKTLNWEQEQKKFLDIVLNTLARTDA